MRFIERVIEHGQVRPEGYAMKSSVGKRLRYAELVQQSGSLACYLAQEVAGTPDIHRPVVVYGHKNPLMLVAMLAAMRSGRPYVPLDCYSVPAARVATILETLGTVTVIATEPLPEHLVSKAESLVCGDTLARAVCGAHTPNPKLAIQGEDICYILFTSGSTGVPKGVEVTAACVDNFMDWNLTLGGIEKTGLTYLDQAPFSFDLSVFELVGALAAGGTLYSLCHETQQSMAQQLTALAQADIDVWVSTPSFADMCLSAAEMNEALLPHLNLFLFCGETLACSTASQLLTRFPAAQVLNTYGPTESTVAVTEVRVTPDMATGCEALPVGTPRPGTEIHIVNEAGERQPYGQTGEIVIVGDTVAKAYFGRPDLTERVFGQTHRADGVLVRSYRTGDEGFLDEQGMLHYRGRLDLQIKLNGFRIELGEIEEQLRQVPGVTAAACTAPKKDGKVSHVVAHVVYSGERLEDESDFRLGLRIKEQLKQVLPHYMIPKTVRLHDALPVTGNGKLDRKALV
ncbi:D-alanine--poly(phosphoribitol) ligase subunit DltA [Collinsella sp. zg1085]|uniref:D-alanine--poly(phosphoribitol) ligase subunit DltA n=1 Tax=Collinsella sp. zg1085 TaxID=2844380 RepID=UPI001C0DE9D8|nr:D-alanine--poly(phosphoribitol) ligase subunit DltA [Collinsella sp. zg1085]QWT17903.1 D-alanine--poly(phosphoribitol) ligase subunit DltA [Collinsella sp. zg1085]